MKEMNRKDVEIVLDNQDFLSELNELLENHFTDSEIAVSRYRGGETLDIRIICGDPEPVYKQAEESRDRLDELKLRYELPARTVFTNPSDSSTGNV